MVGDEFRACRDQLRIFHAMPAVGLGLLDLARSLAALDLPVRVIAFLGGGS
jgi:hypothetical protein